MEEENCDVCGEGIFNIIILLCQHLYTIYAKIWPKEDNKEIMNVSVSSTQLTFIIMILGIKIMNN